MTLVEGIPSGPCLTLDVEHLELLGADVDVTGCVDGTGHRIALTVDRGRVPRVGDKVQVTVDADRLHWCGPDGDAL